MTARVRSGKQQANSGHVDSLSLKPRRDSLCDAKVVKRGGSVTGHVVDRKDCRAVMERPCPRICPSGSPDSFLRRFRLIGVEYMMGLAVSMEHQDRCSVADNLIVEDVPQVSRYVLFMMYFPFRKD